jgi:hypothetical protein
MGIEQLDFLELQADTALSLLAVGEVEQVAAIVQALKPLITEEKRKVSGGGKTWYYYECSACSLKCKAQFKFIPNNGLLKKCWLDGKDGGNFEQNGVNVEA